MGRKPLPPYYKKYRWMIDVTQNTNHPNYYKYGGKGMTCFWKVGEYHEFYHWLMNNLGNPPTSLHQLCRINKRGNFEPNNLSWMTATERSNSGTKQNVLVQYRKKIQSISNWSKELDIPYYTLRRRISKGIPIKDIIKEFQ
jgi:hypothetical protein